MLIRQSDKQDNQDKQDETGQTTRNTELLSATNLDFDLMEAYKLPPQLTKKFIPALLAHCHQRRATWDINADGFETPLFYFVRCLKGHPRLGLTADASKTLAEVEAVILHNDLSWEGLFEVEREDARAEFFDVWEKVRYLPGDDPLIGALDKARHYELVPKVQYTEGYTLFVSLAGWLQVQMGSSNIMLPVERLAGILDCTPMTISRYRRWAVKAGLLREVKAFQFRSGGGSATEFRFNVAAFDCLDEKAQIGTAERYFEK